MDFLEVMHEYFRGERLAGWAMMGLGLPLLAFGAYVFREHVGFRWSLGTPLAALGLALLVGAPIFASMQTKKAADIEARYAADPEALRAEETTRMERVNANWPRLKIGWAVLGVIAMGLLLFVHKDWVQGLGLLLIFICAAGFFIDVFGGRRAVPYTEALAQSSQST